MLESPSGRFPRFIWPDPTRPFANASLRLERVVSLRPDAPPTQGSGLVATITAMAGHLRAWGESRETALTAIRTELEAALAAAQLPAGEAWCPTTIDEVVGLAVDSCYGNADPIRVASPPKPAPRRRRGDGAARRRNDAKQR